MIILVIQITFICINCTWKQGKIPDQWHVITWQQYHDYCNSFAKSLIFLGVGKFKIVNILGFNSV